MMNGGPMPAAHLVRNHPTAGVRQQVAEGKGPRAYAIRSARTGGHAIGGRVVGRYRARGPHACGCCHCRISVG